jgi:hypothetical protein
MFNVASVTYFISIHQGSTVLLGVIGGMDGGGFTDSNGDRGIGL